KPKVCTLMGEGWEGWPSRKEMRPPTSAGNLPVADRPHIDVDEVRLAIDAHTTLPQVDGDPVQAIQWHVLQADIDGHRLQVVAVLGNAVAVGAQHGVGGGRAIGGDDLEGRVAAEPAVQIDQKVEQPAVDGQDRKS